MIVKMKKRYALIILFVVSFALITSCGPSKAEIEIQRLKDSLHQVEMINKAVAEATAKIKEAEQSASIKTESARPSESAAKSVSLCIDMYGTIGGEGELHFYSNNSSASTYSYDCNGVYATRSLRLSSYDSNSGKLILKSYDINNGKYIGQLVGTYTGNTYTGIFTNYKGGKVNFKFRR